MCSAKESWLESEKSWVEMYPSEKKKKEEMYPSGPSLLVQPKGV